MPSAAKQKGNAWERDVAKDLSETFNENFIRVPNSGAYTGGANVFRIDQLTEQQKRMMDGDIICLLYTSPSPRDVEESRMPSSA